MYLVMGVCEQPEMSSLKNNADVTSRVINNTNSETPTFITAFRDPFKSDSEEYYRRLSREWLASGRITDFLKKVRRDGAMIYRVASDDDHDGAGGVLWFWLCVAGRERDGSGGCSLACVPTTSHLFRHC
jgi:hypothetical protein